MTKQEITEGNRLIAVFMETDTNLNIGNGYTFPHSIIKGDLDSLYESDCGDADELIYHESWDWIMPVVIKLISDYQTDFYIERLIFDNFSCGIGTRRKYQQHEAGFKPTYMCFKNVVNFIKWHNLNKPMTYTDFDKFQGMEHKRNMTLDEVIETYPDLLTEKQIEQFKCQHEIMNKSVCAACGFREI